MLCHNLNIHVLIVSFSYFISTGKVSIDQSSLQDILEASAHLQFTDVLSFCSQYLKEQLTIENCLQFLRLAELYALADCKHDTKVFILENFIPVAKSEDFTEISCELLCELLASDLLRASSELDVFNVTLRWLEAVEGRKKEANRMLGLIRYGLMTAEQMSLVYSHPLMLSESCREILQSALNYHMKLFSQPMEDSSISKMRAFTESLVILGAGYLDNTLSTEVMAASVENGRMENFGMLCPVKDRRYFAAVAIVNDFVYVVGGQTAMAGDGSHATNSAFRYNPRDGKWLQISSMTVARTHFALVALDTCLIAVGGKNNRIALNTAEMYDFAANEWTSVPNLPNTLFSHAGCSHGNKVYVSGGCPGEDFTDEVHCYDPYLDGWQLKCPMHQSRGYHVMVSHKDKIYACAGNTNAGDRRDVLNTECYDVSKDMWTVLSPSIQGQSEAPAVKCGKRIFILGGYSWDLHSFQETIQRYDLEEDKWQVMSLKLPEPMTGLVACQLKLPLQLFEGNQYPAHGC